MVFTFQSLSGNIILKRGSVGRTDLYLRLDDASLFDLTLLFPNLIKSL
jgi:hypothetical protein